MVMWEFRGHPLYNVAYMDCMSHFYCHGGLTYSGGGENSSYPISSDLWWFGFDCSHCEDEPDWNSVLKAFPDQSDKIYQQKNTIRYMFFRRRDPHDRICGK